MKRIGHDLLLAMPGWMLLVSLLCFLEMGFSAPSFVKSTTEGGPGSTKAAIPYSVRIWQADDGLPQNSVYAIAQTPDGYLWVGTHEGLTRFDGVRFTLVDDPVAPELKHGWITALCAGSDGSLWIACDGSGVTRLKDGVFSRFSEVNGLPSNQTRCLFEAR